MKTGNLSVQTENIFPIIKQFLYSDQEIFLRELISNATDATQKIKTLSSKGTYKGELNDLKIKVTLDKEAKTLTISDSGIGMSKEEVDKYINQIAFSSAEEFVNKYKDSKDKNAIIGHFGLGFYSSFMVADKVELVSKSYRKNAKAVKWSCTQSTEFEISDGERKERGTDVILHITDDAKEYLEEERITNLLNKYCKFMPVEIEFNGKVINDTQPIWLKQPADLTSQDYQDFYQKLYPFSSPPLFWIHLNVDYPFNLTGILYFPKVGNAVEVQKNKIQLYSNQVFVTDSVEDIVPEFLTLLHGVIDSPDIPLNVSRSSLQADSNVRKISSYIVRKVSDKLEELFKNDRKEFEEKWEDISVFIKYGMLTNDKFAERAKKFFLLKNTENAFYPLEDYQNKVKDLQTDKDGNLVYLYTNNTDSQDSYIQSALKRNYDVLKLEHPIDTHFISLLERQEGKLQVKRVDAAPADELINKDEKKESVLSKEQEASLEKAYKSFLKSDNYNLKTGALNADDPPVLITQQEFERRMKEMSQMGGMPGMGELPEKYEVVVNTNHPLSKKMASLPKDKAREEMAKHVFDLAKLSNQMLKGKEMTDFIKRSTDMLAK